MESEIPGVKSKEIKNNRRGWFVCYCEEYRNVRSVVVWHSYEEAIKEHLVRMKSDVFYLWRCKQKLVDE